MVYVPDLVVEIPKKTLLARLEDEAPHFMRTLMDMQLPPVTGRLRLPIVATDHKQQAEELSRNALEEFLTEHCQEVDGENLLFADLYEAFHKWLPSSERHEWSRIKTSRAVPPRFVVGAGAGNKKYVGNIAWKGSAKNPSNPSPQVVSDGKLKPDED